MQLETNRDQVMLNRRKLLKTATGVSCAVAGIGTLGRADNKQAAETGPGASKISVTPMQREGMFGVELTHADFPGNVIEFRCPECWFSGLLPNWPPPGYEIPPRTIPNIRHPYIVLGPGSTLHFHWQEREDGSWKGTVRVPDFWTCTTTVVPADDHVLIRSSLTNDTPIDWIEVWAHYCANTDRAPDFRDLTARRTIIYLKDGPTTVAKTHHYEPEGWRTICNTYVPIGREMPIDKYLYGCPISQDKVASPLIVRHNEAGDAALAVCYRHYYGLFYDCHQKNNCIHSEPYIGDLESGQTHTLDGHIYWMKGTVADVAAKARRMDNVWVPG